MVNLKSNQFANYCNEEGVCTCDFRINLNGCLEGAKYIVALKCLVPFTFFIVIISISFLYYRVKVKGQSVFFPATRERGMIRPRPQDSFHIAVGAYNFSQTIMSICLITSSFPNVTIAEISVHAPKLLGFACAVLYPISIIYSTPILKQATYSQQWNPNKIFIDGLAIYLMLGPLLTTVPLTALTGHFADKADFKTADNIFMAQAFIWSVWTIQYVITLLYVYYKLNCMLRGYLRILQRRRGDSDVDIKIKKLKCAAHNLTWIVIAVFLMFSINGLEGIIVGMRYKKHMKTKVTYFFISWNFTIPVLTFIGQMIFLYDTLKNRKSPQHQRNDNTYDRMNNIPSHLEQKHTPIAQVNTDFSSVLMTEGGFQSKSAQKSKATMLLLNSNSDKSTNATGWETITDNNVNYHFKEPEKGDEEDKGKGVLSVPGIVTSPGARKSWLVKKPKRTVIIDKNLILQEEL